MKRKSRQNKKSFNYFDSILSVSLDFQYKPPTLYRKFKDKEFPWKLASTEVGLSVTPLKSKSENYSYNDANILQPFDLYRVIIHSPDELPFRTGHHFFLGRHDNVECVIATELTRVDLELWPPEQRQCFFEGEKKLKFFKIYTKVNCEHECLSELTLNSCNCVPFYMIRKIQSLFRIVLVS